MSEAGWLERLTTRLRTIGSKVKEGFNSIVSKTKQYLITNIAQPLGLWRPPTVVPPVPPPMPPAAPVPSAKPVGITPESLSSAGKKVRRGPIRRTVGAAVSTLASAATAPLTLIGSANQYLKEQQAGMEELYRVPDARVSPEILRAMQREREFNQQYRQQVTEARIARRQQRQQRKQIARARGTTTQLPLVLESSRIAAPPQQARASSGLFSSLFRLGDEFASFLDESSSGGRMTKSKRD